MALFKSADKVNSEKEAKDFFREQFLTCDVMNHVVEQLKEELTNDKENTKERLTGVGSWIGDQQSYYDDRKRLIMCTPHEVAICWYNTRQVPIPDKMVVTRTVIDPIRCFRVNFTSLGYAPISEGVKDGAKISADEMTRLFIRGFFKKLQELLPEIRESSCDDDVKAVKEAFGVKGNYKCVIKYSAKRYEFKEWF